MKKNKYPSILLVILISIFYNKGAFAQKIDVEQAKMQKQQALFYRKSLLLDSVKADQVSQVQAEYKSKLIFLMSDTSLNGAVRKAKTQMLMENKNQELKKLLTPAQQEKIIPLSERILVPIKKD